VFIISKPHYYDNAKTERQRQKPANAKMSAHISVDFPGTVYAPRAGMMMEDYLREDEAVGFFTWASRQVGQFGPGGPSRICTCFRSQIV